MENTTIAYIAGLFDGEGSITINRGRGRGMVGLSYRLQVGMTNVNKPAMDLAAATFGGSVTSWASPSRRCWQWRILSNQAANFLSTVRPYLLIKAKPADVALAFQQDMRTNKRNRATPITQEDMDRRQAAKELITALNRGWAA